MAILGLVAFVVVIGIGATCQFARGQIRPYLPPVIRELVTNPEDEAVVDDYLHSVDDALTRLLEDADACKVERDQVCLTKAFERAYKAVGDGVPVEASWMSGAHARLRAALEAMLDVHRRSETEPPTEALVADSLEATDEFAEAVEEWYRQAER